MSKDLEGLEGSSNNDILIGQAHGKGKTSFLGRDGIDTFYAKNGTKDTVTTGGGGHRNKVYADKVDKVIWGWDSPHSSLPAHLIGVNRSECPGLTIHPWKPHELPGTSQARHRPAPCRRGGPCGSGGGAGGGDRNRLLPVSPGLVVMAFIVIALAAAWFGLLRTGILRILGAGVAVVAIAAAVILLFVKGEHLVEGAIVLVGLAITTVAVRVAFRTRVRLPKATKARGALLQPEVGRRQGREVPPGR